MVAVRVLGSLQAEVGGGVADLGGPRQRGVLALLLVARGDVVSVDRLIDDLWRGEPPPRATGALQAYVSNLRRALEPGRPPRAPAELLVSVPPGYAVRLASDDVDAWRFEELVRRAAGEEPAAARRSLEEALGLWHGAAYAEVADEPWAAAEAARLDELRRVARERLVDAVLRSGAGAEAVPEAETLTREQPLREEGWRLLALALYATGRQADALAALRRARETLADELGLDPGPALTELEAAVLAQRVELPTPPPRPTQPPRPAPQPEAVLPPAPEVPFVGREPELMALHDAASAARATGGPRVALVAGDPGAGKSVLADRLRRDLAAEGWRVALGRCPEAEGAPPGWAWSEVLRALATEIDPGAAAEVLAPLLDDAAGEREADAAFGRFRLHRAVTGWLAQAAAERPLAIVLDDLHRADEETLALLRAAAGAAADHGPVPLLLVAAYRPADAAERLEETLAALARHAPARLHLTGLDQAQAARLVREVSGVHPEPDVLAALVERTGGNPFYLRESARLLASEGGLVATSEVPEGVRDVLRRRFARLPEVAVSVLRLAAVIGRDVDLDVLVAAAEVDEETVLDALEAGVLAGLLTEPVPGGVRFTHVLVRETLYGDISRLRRGRWHGRVAQALEQVRPGDLAALAHHHTRAASAATARRAVETSAGAARLADARYAHESASALYRQALANLDRVPPGGVTDDERIDLHNRLLRALIAAGATVAAREVRQQALAIADRAGRDDLLVEVLAAWDVPTPWLVRQYGTVEEPLVDMIERLLATQPLTGRQRCLLLCTLVREIVGDRDERARAAAEEALALARAEDDPALTGLALVELSSVLLVERDGGRRAEHARELIAIGERHRRPELAMLGHHHLLQGAADAIDLPLMRHHLAQAEELAVRYGFGQTAETLVMTHGMLEHLAGRLGEAERRYGESYAAMGRSGAMQADGVFMIAMITLRATEGRMAELLPALEQMYATYGSAAVDVYAIGLIEAGTPDEARRVLAAAPPVRDDFFHVLMLAARGMAVAALGDRELAAPLHEALLPHAHRIAGMSTGSYALRPVSLVLGDLAALLGRDPAGHYADALELARRLGSRPWQELAEAGLRGGASRFQADR